MSNLVQSVIDSPFIKKILSLAGVSEPMELERYSSSQTAPFSGNILVGTTGENSVLKNLFHSLKNDETNIYIPADSPRQITLEQAAKQAECSIKTYQADIEKDLKFKALIFDASSIESSEQLIALHQFFQPVVRKLAKCGRIIVLGKPPESCKNSKSQTAQRALEGFTRCLGKETGKKGITVQLVYVGENSEDGLKSPLEFLLSPRSAYVSAQVIQVTDTKAEISAYDWQKPLDGKVALVTGASRGIGEKIAEVLARQGATVIGADLEQSENDLTKVMNRISGKVLPLDISSKDAPETVANFCKEHFGGLDIIVHNAGITRDKTLGNMPEHFWQMTVDINLSAQERMNDYLLSKKIINKGGRIICVSSVSGIAGNFGQTNYGASKAGVIGMVQSQSKDLAKKGITINAVAPGFIETQMTAAIPLLVREVGKRINALGQGGKPIDVAEAIAFFASPGSSKVTGNVVRVCGQSMLGA